MGLSLFAILIGFLLPWQTRFLLRVPMVQGVAWDFGVVSVFVSQAVLALWLCLELWKSREEVLNFFNKPKNSTRYKIVTVCGLVFLAEQFFVSADRILTLQWLLGVALLVGLGVLLHYRPALRIPFVASFIISIVLQSLLAATQVFTGATFASTLIGVAAHKAVESGTAVVQYAGQRYIRAYGGEPHPNIFGGLALIGIVLFGWLLKYKRTLGVRKNIIQYALLATGALFFSFSRTAWIGFVIWAILLIRERKSVRESLLVLVRWSVIAFVALCVIFFPIVMTRTSTSTPLEARSIAERTTDVARWGVVERTHWFFGTGVGAYTATLDLTGDRRVPVHSVPLLALAEFGFFGIFFVIVAMVALKIRIRFPLALLIIAPLALADHYLYSLWSGHVLLFAFLFQMFEVGDNDEANNNEERPRTDFSK